MDVSSLMTTELVTVGPEDSLDEAWERMEQAHVRHLPVVVEHRLVGMLFDRDVLEATGGLPRRVHACRGVGFPERVPARVAEAVRGEFPALAPGDPLAKALELVLGQRVDGLPVVEEGRLLGIVTEVDLLREVLRSELLPGGETASTAMSPDPETLSPRSTVSAAWRVCQTEGFRHLVVVDTGRVVGLVSDRDLRRAAGVGRRDETALDEIMTPDPLTVGPRTPLREAASVLAEAKIGALPVVSDERLVGILTVTDVLRRGRAALGRA